MCYSKMFKYKKANETYQKGLELDKNNLHILNNLGNLKKDLDQTEEAVKIYKKNSFNSTRCYIAVIYNLAGLYNSMGEIEKSKVLFLKILKHNSKFTEADRIISETTKYEKNNQHFQK